MYNSSYPFNNENVVNASFYNKLANQNLKWEKTNQLNIGLDASLFNNTISFTAEYFDRITDNLILKAPTPPSFGYVKFTDVNIGKMQNKGWEAQLGYHSPGKKDFNWGISANIGGEPISYFQANKHGLLPIPQSEIDRNIKLGDGGVPAQNPGY